MKVFLDTNVLASALSTRGLCSDVLLLVIEEHELITGEVVLSELRIVLRRKFGVSPGTIAQIEGFLRQYHVESVPRKLPSLQLSDRNDLIVIASALDARADMVVTGDAEMLRIKNAGIRILNPREFWTLASRERNRVN